MNRLFGVNHIMFIVTQLRTELYMRRENYPFTDGLDLKTLSIIKYDNYKEEIRVINYSNMYQIEQLML